MNILMITNGWPPGSVGGVQTYTRRLAIELARKNDLRVFCRETVEGRPDYELRQFEDGPVQVTAVNYNFGDFIDFTGTYFNRAMGKVFEQYLGAGDMPDIAHIHHLGGLSHSLVDILADNKVSVVMTQHDYALTCPRGQRIKDDYSLCESLNDDECLRCLKPQCQGDRGGASKLYRYLFRKELGRNLLKEFLQSSENVAGRSGVILAPSGHLADKLARDGFPRDKIRVMEYGYDVRRFKEQKRGKIGLARKFGYLGALIPSKGVHILIEAFKILVKDSPDMELELRIHGPSPLYHGAGDYSAGLRNSARGSPVFFHGPYRPEDLPSILRGLDAVALPSIWWETHGIVLREAKLAGLPVIVSDLGAIGDAVTDGVNGLKFRPGNAKHLRDKMKILAATSGLADKIASNPLPVKTIQQDAADHEKLYSELITGKMP